MKTIEISNAEKNMGLIKSLAISFHRSTRVDYEELVGEAVLAYLEAEICYKDNGISLNSYAYGRIKNHLINFCNNWKEMQIMEAEALPDMCSYPDLFFELMDSLPDCSKAIADLTLAHRQQVAGIPAKKARGEVVNLLREDGWSWSRIWEGMKEIKYALNEIA